MPPHGRTAGPANAVGGSADSRTGRGAARSRAPLLAAVAAAGTGIMALELIGARLIAPFYGAGLHVWAAVISVTLASLALGYWLGGILSERPTRARSLCGCLGGAGIAISTIPWVGGPILRATDPLGIQIGALCSAVALLGPPLAALAAVSPLAVGSLHTLSAGRAAAWVAALSTVAGVAATLATAYWLLPSYSIPSILAGLGAGLVACSLVLALGSLGPRGTAALCAGFAIPFFGLLAPRALPASQQSRVVTRVEASVGTIRVVDSGEERWLLIDGVAQGAVHRPTGTPVLAYPHAFGLLARVRPEGRRCLMLGLGIGSIATILQREGVTTDVVEIEPAIVRIARECFGYVPNGRVFEEDGRSFLRATPCRYDFIVVDAFDGGAMVARLLTAEALDRMHDALGDRGVLAVNALDLVDGGFAISRWVIGSLRARFRHVAAYRGPDSDGMANLLLLASDGSLDAVEPGDDGATVGRTTWQVMQATLGRPLQVNDGGRRLTDGFSPVEVEQARLAGRLRGAMLDRFGEWLLSE